jgi:hypothetical protein
MLIPAKSAAMRWPKLKLRRATAAATEAWVSEL